MSGFYRKMVQGLGYIVIGLGVAILVQTAAAGGGSTGYVLGVLFVALGCGRLFLLRRR
jgi:hypothetical protein